jgi:DNA-binding response OmpR family regulator
VPTSAWLTLAARSGRASQSLPLTGERITVGRLSDVNDIALQPDPQRLVTRSGHCELRRESQQWVVVDGGGANGTLLRRGRELERLREPTRLESGDVICVLAFIGDGGQREYFELTFDIEQEADDTRAAPSLVTDACLSYSPDSARLALLRASERIEIPLRAQAHRLVGYMAQRNADAGGGPVLCTHDELMHAVWADEPMHSREELAKLVWELRRKLAPLDAEHLVETERGLGYRLRTCPPR